MAEILKVMFKTHFVLCFQVDFKTSVFTFRSPLISKRVLSSSHDLVKSVVNRTVK